MAFELGAENAADYLTRLGLIAKPAEARALGGGVSNSVILVESGSERLIVKQSAPRLRVAEEWLADRNRIFRERDAIQALAPRLPKGSLPRILAGDERNYIYVMEAAPADALDWKTRLLAGECDADAARQAGSTLGSMIRATLGDADLEDRFRDQTAFHQLRTDPYYRTIARRHPPIAPAVEAWIEEQAGRKLSMVHGDWSPKNMLVHSAGMVFIDFECAHFGDPGYDAAFLMNHLALKAAHRPERAQDYLKLARIAFSATVSLLPAGAGKDFEASTLRHLAFLLLARIDGKSPAEYISDEETRRSLRRLALEMIADPPSGVDEALRLFHSRSI